MSRRGGKHKPKQKQRKGAGASRRPAPVARSGGANASIAGSKFKAVALLPTRSAGVAKPQPKSASRSIQVWDLAVRLFHWSLVVGICVAWSTGGSGGRVHEIAGYTVAGLVAFRLTWGFVGTRHARFADFVASPTDIFAYLRRMVADHPRRYLGHNPAGGAMIVVLLALISVLSATGWLMLTPKFFGVPWVEDLHQLASDTLLIAIALHLAGVVGSSIMHRENLVWAMITGNKPVSTAVSHQKLSGAQTQPLPGKLVAQGLGLLLVLALLGFGYGWFTTSRRVSTPVEMPSGPASTAPAAAPAGAPDGSR